MKDKLIDTDVFIDFLRGDVASKAWFQVQEKRHIAISAVTVAELVKGCRNKVEMAEITQLLSQYTVHHFSDAISQQALDWFKQFHLSHKVGYLDCLIGATAIKFDLQICTFNIKHFSLLSGVDAFKPY